MASPASAALGVMVRHLAGKHDQKKHAGDGHGGEGELPAGWSFDEDAFIRMGVAQAQLTTPTGGTITVTAKLHTFKGPDADYRFAEEFTDDERAPVRAAVMATAQRVDRLQRANPVDDLDVVINGTALTEHCGGQTTWNEGVTQVIINSNVIRDQKRADEWSESILAHRNAGDPSDVLGTVVTHEYGHVLAKEAGRKLADGSDPGNWTYVKAGSSTAELAREHSIDAALDVINGPGAFDGLTLYAQTSMVEAYAELFTEWSMRDRVTPSAKAVEMAEGEGWK